MNIDIEHLASIAFEARQQACKELGIVHAQTQDTWDKLSPEGQEIYRREVQSVLAKIGESEDDGNPLGLDPGLARALTSLQRESGMRTLDDFED